MIHVLSKPADQIDNHDIESLVESRVPEGEQIEFKEALPAKGESLDPWENDQDKIGDRAKNAILEETVAFANAHGGALVLGIEETGSKPPIAKGIKPVPRCGDLADRLKLVFRDCVEPQLPHIEIVGVETKDRDGVVILRVGRSRRAPHRVTSTLNCPVRRSDRYEKMTMREIQDMTLNVARGLERLKGVFRWREERFVGGLEYLSQFKNWYGLRITAVPVVEDLPLDRVFRGHGIIPELVEPWRRVFRETPGLKGELRWDEPRGAHNWRPILRGARMKSPPHPGIRQASESYREIHCDGLLEWVVHSNRSVELNSDRPVVMFANVATWADRVRRYANAPTAEYAIEVQFRAMGDGVIVKRPCEPKELGTLRPDRSLFPRYSLADQADVPQLLGLFYRDFWNFFEQDAADEDMKLLIENWPEEG